MHGGQEFSTTLNDWQDEHKNSACSHLSRMTCVGAVEQHTAWLHLCVYSCVAVLCYLCFMTVTPRDTVLTKQRGLENTGFQTNRES